MENKVLDELLTKRFIFLKKFSDKEQKEGYQGLKNLRIENNSILFNDNIEDCRYNDNYFYVVGDMGEDKVELTGYFLKKIKKTAREVNCRGL